MRLLPAADSALLIEVADLDEVLDLYASMVAAALPGVVDLVPAARTLLVKVDPRQTDLATVEQLVLKAPRGHGSRSEPGLLEVPVTYDGEDLADVARLTGLTEREVVWAHTSQLWTVAFCGFAPGFGYLVGENAHLEVPRRDTPRTRVPAGAVALAGQYAGVYPRESPGGWQLIGRTTLRAWDLERDPPALLAPGTRVRFLDVG